MKGIRTMLPRRYSLRKAAGLLIGSSLMLFVSANAHAQDGGMPPGINFIEISVSLETTRPAVQIATLILTGLALWSIGSAAASFGRKPRQVAWRAGLRTVGWIPPLASFGLLLLFLLPENSGTTMPWSDKARVVETFIPLAIAIQAALLFSPDDEPALEVLLACPRRISWLLLERLGVAFIMQTGIALVGIGLTLAITDEANVALTALRWIPPAIFLSGVGVYTTLRSRVAAFGIAVVGLVWFAFVFFGMFFIPGQPMFSPLNHIQPYLWPVNAYLQPDMLPMGDYWLNRLFVTAAGIGLMTLAVYLLRDEERVLLGVRKKPQ